jgi:hypothetical protein
MILTLRAQLHRGLLTLSQEIKDPAFMEAVMLPQTFQVTPILDNSTDDLDGHGATLIVLRNLFPIHYSSQPLHSSLFIISPLSLFLAQQGVLPGTNMRAGFAREAHKEFSSLFGATATHGSSAEPSHRRSQRWPFGRKSQLNGRSSNPIQLLEHFMEEGRIKPEVGHDVTIEGGQSVLLNRPLNYGGVLSPQGNSSRFSGIVVQKSVAVTVRDKDPDEANTLSTVSSKPGNEVGTTTLPLLMDDAIWADICLKGVANT